MASFIDRYHRLSVRHCSTDHPKLMPQDEGRVSLILRHRPWSLDIDLAYVLDSLEGRMMDGVAHDNRPTILAATAANQLRPSLATGDIGHHVAAPADIGWRGFYAPTEMFHPEPAPKIEAQL